MPRYRALFAGLELPPVATTSAVTSPSAFLYLKSAALLMSSAMDLRSALEVTVGVTSGWYLTWFRVPYGPPCGCSWSGSRECM